MLATMALAAADSGGPSIYEMVKDFGTTGVVAVAVVFILQRAGTVFKDLRAEEQKRTDAFMLTLQDLVKGVRSTAEILQSAVVESRTHAQSSLAAAQILQQAIQDLKDLRRAP